MSKKSVKKRKAGKFYQEKTFVNAISLLQNKFGENFTIVAFERKKEWWQANFSAKEKFFIEAQVYTKHPKTELNEVFSFSVLSMTREDADNKRLAAKGLLEELRRLKIAV